MSINTAIQAHTYLDGVKQNLNLVRQFQYYAGQHKPPLTPRLGEPNDSVIINLPKAIVDTVAGYLFGQDITFQVDDGAGAKQDYLDLFWKHNEKLVTLQKAAVNGGIAGHTFLRILPETPFPRLVVLDPAAVEVTTDPDDISKVWCFTITPEIEQLDDGATRTLIESPSGQAGENLEGVVAGDRWFITDQEYHAGVWVTVASETWPWSFPPIADCQHGPAPNTFWGVSDISPDILHLIDAINRVASHMNKTLRYFAHPTVYSKGMGSRQIDRSIDAILHLPSTEASLNILEMQSDLSSSLDYLDRLLQYLSMVTRVPATALGIPDNLGLVSGIALKIRYAPLVQKVEQKRLLYGHMIECINDWVLQMAGLGSETDTKIQWFNLIPTDDLQEAQVYQAVDNLGIISKRTLADRLGLDYDSELAEMAAEQALQEKLGLKNPAPVVEDNNNPNLDNSNSVDNNEEGG